MSSRPPGRPGRPSRRDDPAGTHPPAPADRAVYTVKQVAYLLALPLGATYAMVRRGDIPATERGGQWVVPKHRLHKWLDGLERQPEATDEETARMREEYHNRDQDNEDDQDNDADGAQW